LTRSARARVRRVWHTGRRRPTLAIPILAVHDEYDEDRGKILAVEICGLPLTI